jgi:catechol 2,3-dioxygenase-like lactoylglutathione lyase family enzyme
MTAKLTGVVPVLPVGDIAEAVAFYRDRLGFTVAFEVGKYVGMTRAGVMVHVDGESGRGVGQVTVRIDTDDVDGLFAELNAQSVIDPDEPLRDTPFGTRQFSALDCAGNRVTFVRAQ